ncbi:MAG: DUF2070 family protein, partial [Thermoplasmata archaeon]|nr:DUF2070 family protein [Thermoplasmata archaeon]
QGIRALVVEAAGETTAYVLIDGNNLVIGARAPILQALEGLVDRAEVMTTDNHVVHEVDGGVNPIGERYGAAELARDIRALVEVARSDLELVGVAVGRREVPAVPVLGPAYTARLLTSLADTGAVFADAVLMTLALLLTGSLCILAILR